MSALTLFCDIIQSEMQLEDDQVYLWDQKLNIPPDDRLYIAVSVQSCKPYSNIREMVSTVSGLEEHQTVNMQATLGIDIISRSSEARDRKEEVIMALNSTLAQKTQETYAMLIGKVSTGFNNLSEIEGAAIPYRFVVSCSLQYKVTKQKLVEYYDNYTNSVITEA